MYAFQKKNFMRPGSENFPIRAPQLITSDLKIDNSLQYAPHGFNQSDFVLDVLNFGLDEVIVDVEQAHGVIRVVAFTTKKTGKI